MNNKLQEDKIKQLFVQKAAITNTDILHLYKEKEPQILESTVNWRIYTLVQQGIMQRIGRGIYRIGESRNFSFDLSVKSVKIGRWVGKEFPYIDYCLWELRVVNNFTQHLINYNIIFLDVEREVIDSVYRFLKERDSKVCRIKDIRNDMADYAGYICIRPLVTEAPAVKEKAVKVASLEKILVDLYCDKEFLPFRGNEIYHIYKNAFDSYTINESSMLRYASRKEKRAEIKNIIDSIKRQ